MISYDQYIKSTLELTRIAIYPESALFFWGGGFFGPMKIPGSRPSQHVPAARNPLPSLALRGAVRARPGVEKRLKA